MDGHNADASAPRGNDWEVVHLTASAYAAAPGPKEPESSKVGGDTEYITEGRDSSPLFMSGHFSMVQNELESLLKGDDSKELKPASDEKIGDVLAMKYEDHSSEKLEDSLHEISSFDKGKGLPVVAMDFFTDEKKLQGTSLLGDEPDIFKVSGLDVLTTYQEAVLPQTDSRNDVKSENCPVSGSLPICHEVSDDADDNKSGDPSYVWWKRQLLSLYRNAMETSKIWSIFVAAAAALGIGYLGYRWYRGRVQLQQIKFSETRNNEQTVKQAVGPLTRFKDILIANNQARASILPNSAYSL